MKIQPYLFVAVTLFFFSCENKVQDQASQLNLDENSNVSLNDGWFMKRATEVSNDGVELSSSKADNKGWLAAQLPSTVMSILVDNGIYKNPYAENNMAKIPMDSILKPWWFTSTFTLEELKNNTFSLNFDGINYKADVFLNGVLVADSNEIAGAFNTFELEVTENLKQGENHLAILLLPPGTGAYSIGFVDWAPTPPDKNMGIWRGIHLNVSKEVSMSETFVQSDLNIEDFSSAELTISTALQNNTDKEQTVTLRGQFGESSFSHEVTLSAKESKEVVMTSADVPALKVTKPKVWWPVGYGKANLYQLNLSASVNDAVSSKEKVQFGIRKMTDYKNENGHRGYEINGQKILIKGAGWLDKLFLENDSLYDVQQMEYVVDMNMNCVRFEGFWGKDHHIYDLCDEYGLLAMVGFSCHWEWHDYIGTPCNEDKYGCADDETEIDLVASYWESQIKYLRNHASIYSWVGGSDFLPHPELEKKFIDMLKKTNPSGNYLGAAKWHKSGISGGTGVKMEGPYDYVTPNYWYNDTVRGGAFGFNTETGPGPQPPVYSSLIKMYGEDVNYPIDSTWNFHHGRYAFGTMGKYMKAFETRYGASPTLKDFALVSQIASYEAIRPMFEAFRVNQPNTTGIVQWMLNSAWPETFWQLYDFYLQPTGAYFGTKKANEQVLGIYNYGDHGIYLVNDKPSTLKSVQVAVKVFNSKSELLHTLDTTLSDVAGGSHKVFSLKATSDSTEFVFVTTTEDNGTTHKNNYWLSPIEDVIDPNYDNSSWIYTPNLSFCDFTALRNLSKVELGLESADTPDGIEVVLSNKSDQIAFGIQATVIDSETKEDVAPAIWSDNYIMLKGKENQVLQVTFNKVAGKKYEIVINGMNLK
ncbi:MAG: exo-1,4-beta-D-glucosaminidase [Saprospiraceae bacterium]|jgi:exo-1,4-beta-D-glucosaminidase